MDLSFSFCFLGGFFPGDISKAFNICVIREYAIQITRSRILCSIENKTKKGQTGRKLRQVERNRKTQRGVM